METETADGKKYYYHAVQRNTVWEKPENAKIIDQSQLAELIQKSQEEERREQEGRLIFPLIFKIPLLFCIFKTKLIILSCA